MSNAVDQSIEEEEIRAQAFLNELNDEFNQRKNIQVRAEWDYASNITDYNEQRKEKVDAETAEYHKVRGKRLLFVHIKHLYVCLRHANGLQLINECVSGHLPDSICRCVHIMYYLYHFLYCFFRH